LEEPGEGEREVRGAGPQALPSFWLVRSIALPVHRLAARFSGAPFSRRPETAAPAVSRAGRSFRHLTS